MVDEVVPIVVMVEVITAEVTAIRANECRVVIHHPGIDKTNHCTGACDVEGGPSLVSADLGDIPLDRLGLGGEVGGWQSLKNWIRDCRNDLIVMAGFNSHHLRVCCD